MDNQLLGAEKVLNIIGRVLLGLYFVVPGLTKVAGFESMSEYMAAHNVPLIPLLLVMTIILQVGGGASLLLGYRTQLCAVLLAGLTLLISLFMHNFWSYEEGLERAHRLRGLRSEKGCSGSK